MSLIPDFEIGLWNAWLIMLYFIITFFIAGSLLKDKDIPNSGKSISNLSKSKMIFFISTKLIIFPAGIYSIFLPLKIGTIWFYVGLPVTLIGLLIYTYVLVIWVKNPRGKPFTTGPYRYSRHPIYTFAPMFLIGLSIASASWLFLLCPIIIIIGAIYFIELEEKDCLEHYGKAYREYMKRTPRWIGIPKSK